MSAPDFLNITSPPAWTVDALCAQVDPELFYPEVGAPNRDAKAVCAGCEVRSECLAYALAHRERFGVWGGTTERERRRMRRPVLRQPSGRRRPDKREGVVRQLAATLTDPEIAAGIPPARPGSGSQVGAA